MRGAFNRFSTRDWPFAWKFAVPALLAVAATIVMQIVAFTLIARMEGNLKEIVDHKYVASLELATAIERLRAANGDLYLMQIKGAAGLPQKTEETGKAITAQLAQVTERLKTFKEKYATAETGPKIDKALAQLKIYGDAVAFVGSMLDVDFKATVNFVVPLQTSYDEMIEELTQLSAQFLNVSRADSQAAVAEAGRRKLVLMEFGVGALIAIALVTAMIILTTVRSIRTMADATQTLADGQTTVDLGALSRRDELGHIVRALSVFRDNILRVETMKSEQAVAEARAQKEKQDALERLAGTFEVSVGNIVSAVSQASAELERSATMLSTNAERGSRESASAAGTAEETTGYVQTVAAASEELSVSIMDISRRVTESASISDVAVKDAGATEDAVRELVTAVRQIGEIVALIEGVAGQTNLLALNATIEAARAGDAGKGFAVVASEVKALANETARATEDIRQQIGAIQTVTGKTESSIRGIVETIARMQELTNGIARSVEQQGAATQEIAGNAHRVAESAKIMTGAIAAVSEVAEETGNGSSQVLDAASHLARQSTLLRQEVDGFIRVVRSA